MSNNTLDYTIKHHCPVYKREIHPDLCYDSLICLNGFFKTTSTEELEKLGDIEEARRICKECPYSEL